MAKKLKKKRKSKKADTNDLLTNEIFELSRKMRASFTARLQKLELFGGQERIILLLKDNDGMAPSQIANYLDVTAPTITKSLNRLAARDIIVRRVVATDKRRATIHLTNLGHSMIKSIKKEQKKWQKQLLNDLNKADKKTLIANISMIENSLNQMD